MTMIFSHSDFPISGSGSGKFGASTTMAADIVSLNTISKAATTYIHTQYSSAEHILPYANAMRGPCRKNNRTDTAPLLILCNGPVLARSRPRPLFDFSSLALDFHRYQHIWYLGFPVDVLYTHPPCPRYSISTRYCIFISMQGSSCRLASQWHSAFKSHFVNIQHAYWMVRETQARPHTAGRESKKEATCNRGRCNLIYSSLCCLMRTSCLPNAGWGVPAACFLPYHLGRCEFA